jgi:23S rRNA G2069 N7-methylase RlmK/C1962 C5-methylase RlmI
MSLEDFRQRILKMSKHYGKWARRQNIQAYRIYDRDLKDYPFIIERYRDYLHVASAFKEEREGDEEKCQVALQALSEVLEVPPEKIAFKSRRKQKGDDQYSRQDQQDQHLIVQEGGLKFLVNLWDFLDTGLFLDHRIAREKIRQKSLGARVLNLFCYTGSFSVYAAAGGALSVTSVDLSNTYLTWAQENMSLNNLANPLNRFVRADVLAWLKEDPKDQAQGQYDLIILDPPTFSNSKKMTGVLDVMRDQRLLVEGCMRRLAPNGLLFFSNNNKRFELAAEIRDNYPVKEISAQTRSQDFKKNPHKSFLIAHHEAVLQGGF